jgi:hypothetical protein
MLILETETFKLGKLREFLKALEHLPNDGIAVLMVDDTNGNVTIQLSVGNDHSCLALKSKKPAK